MNPRIPKYRWPESSIGCAIFIIAIIGIAGYIAEAGSREAIRVAEIVKKLECTQP